MSNDDVTPASPRLPSPGVYFQLYLGAIRGATSAERRGRLAQFLDWLMTSELSPGVVFHGFARGLESAHGVYIDMARERVLEPAFSWGLDGSGDNDGTKLTAKEKGEAIGRVLAHSAVAFGLLDMEGAWDVDKGEGDETTPAGALVMGHEIRAKAPAAILGDQPWFAMQVHGDERGVAKPIGQGGTFAGFPSDEVASFVDFRAPQMYANDFKRQYGKARYAKVHDRMEREWGVHEQSLARLGLVRPRTVTLQGYAWDDVPWDLVHCLLRYRDRPVIMWCDWKPTDSTVACVRAAQFLVREGFAPVGVTPENAVKTFQRASGLTADGKVGAKTLAKMGIKLDAP